MIPVRLCLRNFLCYRDNVEPLDFTGIHLACLSGENGHGKSALLDAMTWALWGKARASADELIHHGETEMEVEFEFLLGGSAYRVIRKRDSRRQGQTTLELQAQVEGDFHAMTEPTVRQTQERIIQLLRMDYDTFINSAFLLQGRADEFTTKTPSERKQILGDILGLSVYDEYETRAKDAAKEKDTESRVMAAQIAEWDRELALQPQYEGELVQAEAKLAEAGGRLRELDAQVQSLRQERQTLEAGQGQLREARQRLARQQGDLEQVRQQLAAGRQRIAQFEAALADRERIERGHRELAAVRQRHETLNLQLQHVLKLSQRKAGLEKAMEARRQEVLMEKRRLEERAAELRQKAASGSRWTAELRELEAPLHNLAQVDEKLGGLRGELAATGEETARLGAQIGQLEASLRESGEKQALLASAAAQCPLCGSSLTVEHQERLLAEMSAQDAAMAGQKQTVQGQMAGLAERSQALRADIRKAEKQLENLPTLHARRAKLEAGLEDVAQAQATLSELQPQIASLTARVQRADWGLELQADLQVVESDIAAVGYDEVEHEQVRASLTELGGFEGELARLLDADRSLRQEREHAAGLAQIESGRVQELSAAREQEAALLEGLRRWDACLDELRGAEAELDGLRSEEARARQVLGAVRQKLDTCVQLARLREARSAERAALLLDKAMYDELRVAFGKKGLQAMIIENIIPEIEDEANAILFRMTDGRMRIKLDTQRETKAKDVVETLDITVADEWGPRSYELFSGGEAFRINFALRVALARLLARRAGASLQTLIIDEGFGTQDAQGRERLIEAINSIQDDFEKVLVITHIQELRDAFPVQIEVFKTASGSQVRVI